MDSPALDEPSGSLLATLTYWMDVEALTPPDAEDDGDTDATGSFFARHVPDRPYPWAESSRDPDKIFKHFVRFGIFGKAAYHADLVHFLNTSRAEDFDTGPYVASKSYGFAGVFEADKDGFPVVGSLRMPAFALAFQGVRDACPISLDEELDDLLRKMRATFNEMAEQRIREQRAVDDAFIDAIRGLAAETLRWLDDRRGGVPKAVIRSAIVSEVRRYKPRTPGGGSNWELRVVAKKPEPRLPPIDSFYLEHLRMLYRAVRHRNPGLLGDYISTANNRIDCTAKDFIQQACRAASHPAGRWPSKHQLTLMQQVAVDLMWRELGNGGLFSVNGPPGTGKTTLLMDVIAAVVVSRAEAMSAFEDPKDAFTATAITAGPDKAPVWKIHESLADHLIAVASSNNGAVENVTVELPNTEKVDLAYLAGFDYFSETANALLGKSSGEETEEDEEENGDQIAGEEVGGEEVGGEEDDGEAVAWGLVAGVLGNRRNKKRFASTLRKREVRQGIDVPAPGNIFAALANARRFLPDWKSGRRRFMDMLILVRRLQAELDSLDLNELNERRALAARNAAAAAVRTAVSRFSDASERRQEAEVKLLAAQKAFQRIDEGARLLEVAKPFRFRLSAYAAWHERYTAGLAERSRAAEYLGTCEDRLNSLSAALSEAEHSSGAARYRLAEAKQAHLAAQRKSRAVKARHPQATTPDSVAAQADERQRQQMLPGTSARLHDARARLFVEALRLHLAFVCGAGERFDRNLDLALAMIEDQFWVRHVVQKAAPDLWATLALVTPVVSTTFASLPRTFPSMGSGSIPWLLIDEAGQCVAHHAAGGIWRAKRAIVVGDPFQVEPVITFDRNADEKLAQRRGVPERLFSTGTSSQRLADEASRHGTWMMTDKVAGPIWVGCPLIVHRRCVEPMFSISNRLAYNGKMVLADGKIEHENELTRNQPLLGPSAWIDVPIATGGPKHFIPEQADIVRRVIRTYLCKGFVDRGGLPDVFVVTPFRSVADGVRSCLVADLEADGVNREKAVLWGKACVGTVHTVQGREKDSVVLFLGGTSEGAIQWASGTPNILNVAVSRAKRRLYVVGHRSLWLKYPLVTRMAGVRVIAWREAGASFGLEELPHPQPYKRHRALISAEVVDLRNFIPLPPNCRSDRQRPPAPERPPPFRRRPSKRTARGRSPRT